MAIATVLAASVGAWAAWLAYAVFAHRHACSGDGFKAGTGDWRLWRWCWRRVLGLPLGRVHLAAPREAYEAGPDNATKQFIFGSHPHGVVSMHHMGLMMCRSVCAKGASFEEISPMERRRDLAASVLFFVPGFRQVALWAGAVDASKPVARRMLKRGLSLGIIIGGEQEQLLSKPGRHLAYIESRKGFCRLALEHGASVVPCWCFGENELYDTSDAFYWLRRAIVKAAGVAIPLAVGRSWLFPWRPHPVELNQCVGTPISVARTDNPTEAQVEALHAKYKAGLREVFDANKARFGYAEAELKMV